MVALEAPTPPPLSPAQSAFLAAYVDAKNDIRATAQKLQIPLQNAIAQFAEPALQAHLTLLDESDKRAARQTAVATIHQAIAGLNRALEYKGDPSHTAKASGHLARAALWLVRIVEGKVGPDSLPRRHRRGDGPPELPKPESGPASEADRLEQTLKALRRLRALAPEILASRPSAPSAASPPRSTSGHNAQVIACEHADRRSAVTPPATHTRPPVPASLLSRAGTSNTS